MKKLVLLTILTAAMLSSGCGDGPIRSHGSSPLMTISVVDTAGNPVPGLRVGSINHSAYLLRPAPPSQALPATQIQFTIPQEDTVWLTVLNYYGDLVATIIDGEVLAGGTHSAAWSTDSLPGGYYRYHLVAGDSVSDKWIVYEHGWDPAGTVIGETDAGGHFVSSDTLLFPCLLGAPPAIVRTDQSGNVIDTVTDFYNDTITIHLSDPAQPDSFYFFDRAVQTSPNSFKLTWTH